MNDLRLNSKLIESTNSVVCRVLLFVVINATMGVTSFGQKNIGFSSKTVNSEIKKTFSTESFELEELDIMVVDEENKNGVYASVRINEKVVGYAYVGRVNSCRTGGCSLNKEELKADGSHEYFDYLVLFDNRISVKIVKVINYQASHGHEISARGWLKQFIGYNGQDEMQVGKNIDAISGATISVYAITYDVNRVTRQLAGMQKNSHSITGSAKLTAGS